MTVSDGMEQEGMEDIFLQDDLRPTIAEHASQCAALFKRYMAMPGLVPDPTVMDDQMARFNLWTSNMDVFGPSNVSLDYRLRYSSTVVEIIHQLLNVICDTLSSLKPIDEPPQSPSRKKQRISERGDAEITKRAYDDASDSDGEGYQAEENVSKITYTIGGTVTRLFRLSNAVRKSAAAKRAHKIGKYQNDEEANKAIDELRDYTDCYIKFRFPGAPVSLRSALVEANTLRLRRLYYQRSHRRRIGLSVQHQKAKSTPVQLPKMPDKAPAVQFAPSALPKPETTNKKPETTGAPTIPITNATTARQTAVGAFYAKSTTEVPRAKSVLVNNKLSFPPIPPTNECPYCGVIIEFKSVAKEMMWHDHVVRDLEPFICVFTECTDSYQQDPGSLTFETSKAWMNHLGHAHGSTWECRAPSHNPITFESELQYQEHSIQEHGVPAEHVSTLSGAARRPILNKISECPFGDDFQGPEKAEASSIFATEALHLHVAGHMKQIALLTLQKLPDDNEAEIDDFNSDQAIEDGKLKLRPSMYSVLDDEELDPLDGDSIRDDISPSVEKLSLVDKNAPGTTLHQAVRAGDVSLVRTLIEQGGNLRSRTEYGKTALQLACLDPSQRLDMVKLLLNLADGDIMTLGDEHNQTPLHAAAESGFIEAIKLMADHGVDINVTDINGFSPFLWAVVAGRTDVFELLLTLGADINSTSADGKGALGWAAGLNRFEVATSLVDAGADITSMNPNTQATPLHEAAANGSLQIMQKLVLLGADPNHRDRDGFSALHKAAEERRFDIAEALLEARADVDAISSYGTTALHSAANGGSDMMVRLLLRHGADPLKQTCHGWTALHHAAFMGNSEVVYTLLEHGRIHSHASHQDNHGWTALHLGIQSRDLTTVKTLLSSSTGAESLNLSDESGFTAEEWLDFVPMSHSYKATSNLAFGESRCCRVATGLREAVVAGNIPMIELLLKEGDAVNGTDSGRRTALYYAAKKGILPIMDILIAAGADPNILPKGRSTYDEFISDDKVLSRLVQAGYRRPTANPEIDQQIRLALRGGREPIAPEPSMPKPSTRSPPLTYKKPAPVSKAEEPRSGLNSFWKRLRGQ